MIRRLPFRWLWGILLLCAGAQARADLLINEILFKRPSGDTTNEYIELRGTPNMVIPQGTYLLSIEGDAGGNPGAVQNRFDLSGRQVGQNGFLVLLQKFHRYTVNPLATVITNSDSDGGWGSGSSSSVRHRGESSQTELENPSLTFFLIQTATTPNIGDDIDANDDGVINPSIADGWTILDAVSVLDNDGDGDIAYGRITFRRDASPGNAAMASGTIVSVPFTPGYVGRSTNSTGWASNDWVASDNLLGAPRLFLGANSSTARLTNTYPWKRTRAALNHIGGPNFGAKPLPAVLIKESLGSTSVREGGPRDSYTINLAFRPSGAVTTRVDATFPLQISTDGVRYTNSRTLVFTTTAAKRIFVRVPDDRLAGPSPLHPQITHTIVATRDVERYPTNTVILPVTVTVLDNAPVILSEAKVNPPGIDAPFEYVELRGPPGMTITNLHLVSVEGEAAEAGEIEFSLDLTGRAFGSNGLLVVTTPGNPYTFGAATAVFEGLVPEPGDDEGALDNNSVSLLLMGSLDPIPPGVDLDQGDNGILEGLPESAVIMDALGWKNSGSDVLYGGVDLTQGSFTPDAASRVPGYSTALSVAAWMVGDLAGTNGAAATFDFYNISTNMPPGSALTPGFTNRFPPRITSLTPLTHVIGDPDNPFVTFTVSADNASAASLNVTAFSTNQSVVPDENLVLTHISGGMWRLSLSPVGAGYSRVFISASDGTFAGLAELLYAASEPGRPGGHWLTGISDASTAIPIDANWMLVGDDENQTIRVYSRVRSGPAVKRLPLNAFLDLRDIYTTNGPVGQPKEVDIEGSTRVGNRIYWIGSHSHAFDATERTNRARLFGTDLTGSGTNVSLSFLAHYDFLKLDLLEWDANNLHGRGPNYFGLTNSAAIGTDPKASDGSGFNIEGLCMAPGSSTTAYVALRAPLVPPGDRALALIVPVTNFATLATRSGGPGSARFGTPIELNLGGRGIRSIEGSGTNYFIVAGPPGGGTNNVGFRLFTWNGRGDDPPRERSADLTGLNPEGIAGVPAGVWTSNTLFQIISDNGTAQYYGDGIDAKHLPVSQFKKFRVDTVALGGIVAGAPVLRPLQLTASGLKLSWLAEPGATYRVQCNTGLDPSAWRDLGVSVTASGATASAIVPNDSAEQCFYRVVVVP